MTLTILDSDQSSYFWLYINLKYQAEHNLGGLMLLLSQDSSMTDEEITTLLACLLKGKPIKRFFAQIPSVLLSRFVFPRTLLETWKTMEN